jgi:hypothetical protein
LSALTTLQVGSAISYLIAVALPALDALIEAARRIVSRWKGGSGRA